MSIANEIQRIKTNIQDAFDTVSDMGGTYTEVHSDNLADAIASIPQGGSGGYNIEPVDNSDGTQTLNITDASGGSLPLGITEMESGQFIVPSDTQGRMTIQFTNFTSAPTHVVVWTKSITPAANVIKNILYDANGIPLASDQITMRYNTAGTGLQAMIGYVFQPSATGIQVGANSGFVWQGGVVYYWMAWR